MVVLLRVQARFPNGGQHDQLPMVAFHINQLRLAYYGALPQLWR